MSLYGNYLESITESVSSEDERILCICIESVDDELVTEAAKDPMRKKILKAITKSLGGFLRTNGASNATVSSNMLFSAIGAKSNKKFLTNEDNTAYIDVMSRANRMGQSDPKSDEFADKISKIVKDNNKELIKTISEEVGIKVSSIKVSIGGLSSAICVEVKIA